RPSSSNGDSNGLAYLTRRIPPMALPYSARDGLPDPGFCRSLAIRLWRSASPPSPMDRSVLATANTEQITFDALLVAVVAVVAVLIAVVVRAADAHRLGRVHRVQPRVAQVPLRVPGVVIA